jgi:uncharacterized protein (TIGR02186 family)
VRLRPGLAWLLLLLSMALPARAHDPDEVLVADLSEHLIAITTAFVGTTVVLFGATNGTSEIVVTVVGPREDVVVRRKARLAGIWINAEEMTFAAVPTYYFVAGSKPLDAIAHPDIRSRLELGLNYLTLEPTDAAGRDISEIKAFEDALIRNKQDQALYSRQPSVVRFVGERLFRTSIEFPANVPPGIYQVQVFELRDRQVTDAQRSTLVISKIGLEADLFDFAHNRASLYGIAAIVVSITAGWLAGIIFRRD